MMRSAALVFLLLTGSPVLAQVPGPPPSANSANSEILTPQAIGELTLDELFEKLPQHSGSRTGRLLEGEIQRRFHKSGSDTADLLFSWGVKAFEQKNYTLSLDLLDQVIMLKPDFAEGWNKRATVHYMLDNYSESLADIRQALLLEPRHFGALSGLGIILDASGRKPDALKALRRALEINPQMEQVKKTVERLEKETSGQAI